MTFLSDRTWVEVEEFAAHTDLILCMGSLEQHGPHLPLDTDTIIVKALADRWARSAPNRLVGPIVPLGASGEHTGFPGTISIGTSVTADLIVEAVRSCADFQSVVVASWHGGNGDAMARARETLLNEGRAVTFWTPTVRGDAHAGWVETSMMLAIAPHRVSMAMAEPGVTEPLDKLLPRLRTEGVRPVAPNGVLGDPSDADPDAGAQLIADIVRRYEAAFT